MRNFSRYHQVVRRGRIALVQTLLLAHLACGLSSFLEAQQERPPIAIPVPSRPLIRAVGTSPSSGYRLSPNDVIHIRVFQEEDLETSARISKNGTIPFPLLGSVNIGGKTVQDATTAIESALHEYLVRPQLALRIVEYNKQKFTVLGQVNRPGTYDFPDDSTLSVLEAIGMAAGYTRIANPSRITIKRTDKTGDQVFHVDGKRMARNATTHAFDLRPGDMVFVEESLF